MFIIFSKQTVSLLGKNWVYLWFGWHYFWGTEPNLRQYEVRCLPGLLGKKHCLSYL